MRTRGVVDFETVARRPVPWASLFTSPAVWVTSFYKFTDSFMFNMFLTQMPNYLHYMFNFPIEANGWINSLAFSCNSVVSLASSWAADRLITANPSRITAVRIGFECTAQFLAAATMIGVAVSGCNHNAIVVLLIVNSAGHGFTAGGSVPVVIDIGPSQAGAIQGLSNMVSNVAGILGPVFVGAMTKVRWFRVAKLD